MEGKDETASDPRKGEWQRGLRLDGWMGPGHMARKKEGRIDYIMPIVFFTFLSVSETPIRQSAT